MRAVGRAAATRDLVVTVASVVLAMLPLLVCTAASGPEASGSAVTQLVFAHYFTPYPISPDNEPAVRDYYTLEYLDEGGEGGRHRAYGGLLRDRPAAILPGPSDSWEIDNYKVEILQAQTAGVDGFTVDMLSTDGVYLDRVELLVRAAHELGTSFTIVLMPDGAVLDRDVGDELADVVSRLARYDSLHRLADGRLVIAPFRPERFGAEWWDDWMADMAAEHDIAVALVPCFLDYRSSAESFAPISHGLSYWGRRSPAGSANDAAYAADAAGRDKLWMQPVSVQDNRPAQGVFDEPNNSEHLRTSWGRAIADADWVQLVTWNDYAEGTQFAPSQNSGTAILDITAYYAEWFHRGAPPQIVRDALYLSHRVHPADAEPTGAQTQLMTLREGSSPARDQVEILAFLAEPAQVTVEVGGQVTARDLDAGVSVVRAPLAPGLVRATARRDGLPVAGVTSPHRVTSTPLVQDMGYRFAADVLRSPFGCGLATPSAPIEQEISPELPRLARC